MEHIHFVMYFLSKEKKQRLPFINHTYRSEQNALTFHSVI